jgi:hypothetical protein
MAMLDLAAFRDTPLSREPFEYLIVPGFVRFDALARIHHDFPVIAKPGSFPLADLSYGPAFASLIAELNGLEIRIAFEQKFGLDLSGRPTMVTVRGCCRHRDGSIHTDTATKIITVLIYMNPAWEPPGGRLRLLRSAENIEDMIVEVPPLEGTMLAFRRSDNSWHGHKPFAGPRRVIQFNWVTSASVVRREQMRHRFSAAVKKLSAGWIWRRSA